RSRCRRRAGGARRSSQWQPSSTVAPRFLCSVKCPTVVTTPSAHFPLRLGPLVVASGSSGGHVPVALGPVAAHSAGVGRLECPGLDALSHRRLWVRVHYATVTLAGRPRSVVRCTTTRNWAYCRLGRAVAPKR